MPAVLDVWAGLTGVMLPYSLLAPPDNVHWILADGRVLLPDTPHQGLRAKYIADGFIYGNDGSGNPRVPDMRGRVPAGKDNMGGTAANRLTGSGSGVSGVTMGAAGGAETHTLAEAQMPSHTHGAGTLAAASAGAHSHTVGVDSNADTGTSGIRGGDTAGGAAVATSSAGAHSHTITGSIASAGSGQAHNNVQPTLVANYIIKT